jgi:signal transduction histidine kinase
VILLTAIIAAIDLAVPANIDIGIFYFVPIVLSIWTKSIRWLWVSTVGFIFLTFAGIELTPMAEARSLDWVDWLNRAMTAAALIVAAVAVHLRIRTVRKLEKSIAERDEARRALQETNDLLEKRVVERTSQLAQAVGELRSENANRRKVEEELRESERSLRELSTELLHAQDEERRRLGQELHDGVGQCLAALKLSLQLLNRAIPEEDAGARQQLGECVELASDAVSQVRTISHLMYPPTLELVGLASAVPWFIKGFEERSGIRTTLEMTQGFARLPQDLELAVFRIIQECLTNIHRHSGSATARVSLQITNDAVVLNVEDEGKGLDNSSAGVGLRSMRERATRLNGTFEVSSKEQGGVAVTAAFRTARPSLLPNGETQ